MSQDQRRDGDHEDPRGRADEVPAATHDVARFGTRAGSATQAGSGTGAGPGAGAPSGRRRWAVPALVAGVVAVGFATPPLVAAAGSADLPDVTAEEIVADLLAAEPTALQGTVVHTARLGLPELPVTELDGADPIALLGGSSTIRVWTDGVDRSRLALLGSISEYSVVRDGPEAWTYSSSDDEVVHVMLDEEGRARYDALAGGLADGTLEPPVAGDLPTPQEGADLVLGALRDDSHVSVDAPTRVAGRDAYQLVVTPQDAGTLVARVVLAVDAETAVPLRYQVWSTQDPAAPAIEVAFTDVAFTAPDDAVLEFSAPAGASVREVVVPAAALAPDDDALAERKAALEGEALLEGNSAREGKTAPENLSGHEGEHPDVTVTGAGWSRVVEVTGVDVDALAGDPAALTDGESWKRFGSEQGQELFDELGPQGDGPGFDLDTQALYQQLTSEVAGGRMLASSLLSVLVTDDGRMLVGAVPPETLQDLA